MRLFHFSADPRIARFEPQTVRIPSPRAPGKEWLNGPLVWAIDDWHQPMYLFPRDCPRILLWPLLHTSDEDRAKWFGNSRARMIAHIEETWVTRLSEATIYRYELPTESFESLNDAGMWVSRTKVRPLRVDVISDLHAELTRHDVELKPMPSLTPLKPAWHSSLHVSGIRLRNAQDWT